MDKFNTRSAILFAIVLSIGFHSADLSPLSDLNSLNTNRTDAAHHRTKSILVLFETHNSSRTVSHPPSHLAHSASATSWIVGLLMTLKSVFDSKVLLLQTLVNPMYPFTYGRKLFDEMNSESRLLAQTAEQENNDDLNLILDTLKPKIVDGLSKLADSGLLNQISMDYSDAPANSTLLSDELRYDLVDLVDYDSYSKAQHSNRTHGQPNELGKKQANSSQELAGDDKLTSHKSENAVKPPQKPAVTIQLDDVFNRTAVEFREMQSEQRSNSADDGYIRLSNESNNSNQTRPDAPQSNGDHPDRPVGAIVEQDLSNKTVSESASSDLNSTGLASNDLVDLDKPIVSLVICDDDGKNCKEEEIDTEFLNGKPTNETEYSEPSKQVAKRPDYVRTALRKLFNRLTGLSERPVSFLKESLISLKDVLVKEFRLISRMIRVLFGSRSPTCRHKFLCLFSSFFSLHTPEFVKTNMPITIENHYIQIMEAANRYESLNALVSGYAGFDCNEFYSGDQRCPD